jgi:cation diffusion facilitator family transporter
MTRLTGFEAPFSMHAHSAANHPNLTRFAWLSIAAALVTIGLKTGAYLLTGSVGLLSDALESVVNLVAAVGALVALTVAAREPDEEHAYGHTKAEYFSSGLEGALIFIAAIGIMGSAFPRLIDPQPLDHVGAGLVVSVMASIVNGVVAWQLFRAARAYRSVTLDADARHLVTDVWTSVGVVLGVALVGITGWERLDAIVALAVAANIIWSGWGLIDRSIHGLLDTALPQADIDVVDEVVGRYRQEFGIETHAFRSRQAGRRRFVSMHVLVPGEWSVSQGHQLVEHLEIDIREELPDTTVFTHLEPLGLEISHRDEALDRSAGL